MEPEVLLVRTQETTTSPSHEPNKSSSTPHHKTNFQSDIFPSGSSIKMNICPSCATNPTLLILFYMITWIIFGE